MIDLEKLKNDLSKEKMCSVSQWTYIMDDGNHYGIYHSADGELLEETDDFIEAILLSRKISNELDYKRSSNCTHLVVMPQIGSYILYNNISLDDLLVKFSTFPSSIFDIYTCIFDVKDYLAQYTKVENNCNRIAPRTLKKLINELVTNQQIAHYTKTNYLYPKKEYDDVEYPDDLKEINILEWGKSCGLLYDNAVKDDLTFYDLFIEIKNNGYSKDQMYTFLNAEDSDIITICKSKLDMLVNRLL